MNSKFHSTVSRRDFMKGLGLAGIGLGAASAAAPAFRDLDELASSDAAIYKEPWFVRELEIEKPSVEVDWQVMDSWRSGKPGEGGEALEGRWSVGYGSNNPTIREGSRYNNEVKIPNYLARIEDNTKASVPGYQLKDHALNAGAGYLSFGAGLVSQPWTGMNVTTPEGRGLARWSGTAEEANRMVRAAAHFLGIEKIGVIEINNNTKKLWNPTQKWDDIDQADPDDSSRTIPNKCKYGLTIMVRQPLEMTKRGPSPQNVGATLGYMYNPILRQRMQRFIKSLGYQCLDRDMTANVAAAALTGIGELSRISHAYTHEWGTALRYHPTLLTDLPLAPTKPISFGGHKFCETCKICGQTCQEINGLSPISMETEPTYDITGPWNRIGVKTFQFNWPYDYFCNYCQASCPWTNHGMSMVHDVVKSVSANTSIFNSFFTQMEHVFGYSRHWEDTDRLGAWWDRNLNKDPFDIILA